MTDLISSWTPEVSDRRVTVVVPDATRPIPVEMCVAPLVSRLCRLGAKVTVLVALGLHRPMTADELAPLTAIATRWNVPLLQHDARSPDLVSVVSDLGILPSAVSGRVHPAVASADRVITVGWVEPHQYAGFSGGIKTVAIGCAGQETIGAQHGLSFLRDPKTCLGVIDGNPFQRALWAIQPHLPPIDALLVVPTGTKTHEVFLGPVKPTFQEAVSRAKQKQFEAWDQTHEAVHVKVPSVKAQNFYQASRAATYLALVPQSVVVDGGAIIVQAACREGLGQGPGERAFAEILTQGKKILQKRLRDDDGPLVGGQQRAFVLVRTLQRVRLAVVGAPTMPVLHSFGVLQTDSVEEAARRLGVSRPPVQVDDVFRRVPVFRRKE